jgi:hypothetical protein
MRSKVSSAVLGLASAALLWGVTTPAFAKCTRLGFSVNDYGKDGPTKDAKELLDKYVAEWAKSKGITNYRIGKKDVSCELFLNLILFDEHTCKAEAQVCWGDGEPAAAEKSAAKSEKAASKKKSAKRDD